MDQDLHPASPSDTSKSLRRFIADPSDLREESASAKLAVDSILKKPLNLEGRDPIKAYAIDSANPKTPMDRDDAINVDFYHDAVLGNLATLHVTISDVASVIPAGAAARGDYRLAALDAHAENNGETLYFSHGVAPMLPRALQDRLSLEDGKERAGLTISITFNDKCEPIHTQLSRTRVTTECKSYRGAAIDIQQFGHPLQQIAVLAGQLLKNKEGITSLPRYDEKTGCYTDSEGVERHVSPDELSSFKTVQGCMIAANEGVASLMKESSFLFRNHSFLYTPKGGREQVVFRKCDIVDDGMEGNGRLEPNRAEYSSVCIGHFGLDSPAYSHVTSPIRRYADLINQRMMHWAIDVVDAVIAGILQAKPSLEATAVQYAAWAHAPELLAKAAKYKQAGRSLTKGKLRHELGDSVVDILNDLGGVTPRKKRIIIVAAVAGIQATHMPYHEKDIALKAQKLNKTLTANRYSRRDFSQTTAWLTTVFPNTDPLLISEWTAGSFAELLEAAAKRGDNNEVFTAEVTKRIEMASRAAERLPVPAGNIHEAVFEKALEEAELSNLVQNLHSILIVAERRKDSHWADLKTLAFDKLKNTPVLTEELFWFMQEQQKKMQNSVTQSMGAENATGMDTLAESQSIKESKQTDVVEATLLDHRGNCYPSALVVLTHKRLTSGVDGGENTTDEKEYSAPVIDAVAANQYASLDEAEKAARQSAILTFFRHYGDLNPHEELYTPSLIEMELELSKVKRGDKLPFLRKVCNELFDIEYETRPAIAAAGFTDNKTYIATLRVIPRVGDAIITEAKGPEDRAIDKAADKMLFNRKFRDMLALIHKPVTPPKRKKSKDNEMSSDIWSKVLEFDRRSDICADATTT